MEDSGNPLIERIEGIARRAGAKTALADRDRRLDYAAVGDLSARLSRRLLADPARASTPVVALGLPRVEGGVALAAALRAQRPYVALEAGAGEARLAAMIQTLGAGTVLVGAEPDAPADALRGRDFDVVGLDVVSSHLGTDALDHAPGALDAPCDPRALAWIIFTSGSTGRPKGVTHTFANVHSAVLRAAESLQLVEDDRVAVSFAPSSLAGFVYPLAVLQRGATIYFVEPGKYSSSELLGWLREQRITVLALVPTLFRRLARLMGNAEALPHLRYLRLTGEAVTVEDLDLFRQVCPPDCVVGVGYATTESGAITEASYTRESAPRRGRVPVGRAHRGVEIELVDPADRSVPAGEPGEIVVSGPFLSPGYWKRPDLTEAVLSQRPDGRRRYRTGDLGILRRDGTLEHIGRIDSQVQIFGHRVELAEIEAALRALDGVADAAVRDVGGSNGEVSIAASIVVDGTPTNDGRSIREMLARTLPPHMLPTRIVFMDALPLTRTGKIDRQALPDVLAAPPTPYVAPRTETEAVVAAIWGEVLGIDRVGVHAHFLELGGDSIAAMRIAGGLEARFGAQISLAQILTVNTVAGVAAVVDDLAGR